MERDKAKGVIEKRFSQIRSEYRILDWDDVWYWAKVTEINGGAGYKYPVIRYVK